MNFDMGMYYGVVAAICAIVIAILLNRTVSTKYKKTIDKQFVNLLNFFILFCFIDSIWGFFSSRAVLVNYWGMTIFSYGFHLFSAISAFVWLNYIAHFLKVDLKKHPIIYYGRFVILAIQITILGSNIFTNNLFAIDTITAQYHTYTLRNIMFYVQFSYYVTILLLIVRSYFFSSLSDEQKATYRTAAIYSITILIMGIGQMFLPDVSMYSLGFMLSAVMIYSFNITTQREDYLRETYEKETNRLSSLITKLSDDIRFVYYVDLNTNRFKIFNSKDKMIGVASEDSDFFNVVNDFVDSVVYEKDREKVRKQLNKEYMLEQLSKKNTYTYGFRNIDGNSYKYYRLKVVKQKEEIDDNNQVIIGIYDENDRVIENMISENKLREAMNKAEQANKAKTEFLFNMSHDIRTPMNAILGFADMAKRHIKENDVVEKCIDKVLTSGDYLLSLINDILDMSRIEAKKIKLDNEAHDIVEQCDSIASIVRQLADKKRIIFTDRYDVQDRYASFDSLRFNQILMNILSNSIKYTNNNGTVDLYLQQIPNNKKNYTTYRVTVSDNGIGMSKEFLERIYEKFAREKSATKSGAVGTGLGMSIVKELVDLMNGTIDIKSEVNKGTVVTIELNFETKTIEDVTKVLIDDFDFRNKRILVVEDNELNREIVRDILEEKGFIVEEAEDGIYAVQKIKKAEAGYFDAVLMDVQMPVMDGYEATKKIRAIKDVDKASVPIIAITANAFAEDKKNAIDAGMNAHISKPIKMDEFIKTLATIIK